MDHLRSTDGPKHALEGIGQSPQNALRYFEAVHKNICENLNESFDFFSHWDAHALYSMPVWESRYKLVVMPQVVSVFIQIDLTKGNRSHC